MPAEYMFYSKIRIVDSKNPAENEPVHKKNDLKINFYPESGRYFSGMMATIAFKTNYKNLTGFIQNSKGEKVVDFCIEHEGMGRVMFFPLGTLLKFHRTKTRIKYMNFPNHLPKEE